MLHYGISPIFGNEEKRIGKIQLFVLIFQILLLF